MNMDELIEDFQYIQTVQMCENDIKTSVLPHHGVSCLMELYLLQNELCLIEWVLKNKMGFIYLNEYWEATKESGFMKHLTRILYHMFRVNDLISNEEFVKIEARLKQDLQTFDSSKLSDALNQDEINEFIKFVESEKFTIEDIFPMRKILKIGISEQFKKFMQSEYFCNLMRWYYLFQTTKINSEMFHQHRILGRGGFGEVYGCTKLDTNTMYAMKVQFKKRMSGCYEEVMNEQNILKRMDHPMLMCMPYAYTTKTSVIFILDLMLGGDLSYNLASTQEKKMSESKAIFYLAEILLGVEYLHNHSIIYHDLKPTNILLDKFGHCKLSDFGLSQDISEKSHCPSYGGTSGYMAPEIIAKQPHSFVSDWFSYGCLMFKLLTGKLPFDPPKKRDRILEHEQIMNQVVTLPQPEFTSAANDLFLKLVERNPSKRISSNNSKSALEIKQHQFFANVDWNDVYDLKMPAPILPSEYSINAYSTSEIGYIRSNKKKKRITEKVDEDLIQDLEYKNFQMWQHEIIEKTFVQSNEVDLSDKDKYTRNFNNLNKHFNKSDGCIIYGIALVRKEGMFAGLEKKFVGLFPKFIKTIDMNFSTNPKLFDLQAISGYCEIVSKSDIQIQLFCECKSKKFIIQPFARCEIPLWKEFISSLLKKKKKLVESGTIKKKSANCQCQESQKSNIMKIFQSFFT